MPSPFFSFPFQVQGGEGNSSIDTAGDGCSGVRIRLDMMMPPLTPTFCFFKGGEEIFDKGWFLFSLAQAYLSRLERVATSAKKNRSFIRKWWRKENDEVRLQSQKLSPLCPKKQPLDVGWRFFPNNAHIETEDSHACQNPQYQERSPK